MVADGIGDLGRLPGEAGILPAHHPLELRKLSDHPGHQVGLAEEGRSAHGIPKAGLDPVADPEGELLKTHHLLVGGAKFGLENDLLELFDPSFERNLPILLEKIGCVGEPRA